MNEYTITEAAEKVLLDIGGIHPIDTIYNDILVNELYSFKENADHEHILKTQINRKCINSNLSYKNKDILFFTDKDGGYGLLSAHSRIELENYLTESEIRLWFDQESINSKEKIDELEKKLDKIDKAFLNLDGYLGQAESVKSEYEAALNALKKSKEFQASRQYWENKQKLHSSRVKYFSVAFIVSLLFMFIVLFIMKDNILPSSSNFNILSLGVLVFTTSIIIWISRTLLKIVLSNLHLLEEAREKDTMISTYLALINEDAGLEEGDRRLVLEAIFRTSSNGLIKDDSNVTILDIAKIFKAK